jgi:Leucine Rich repeat
MGVYLMRDSGSQNNFLTDKRKEYESNLNISSRHMNSRDDKSRQLLSQYYETHHLEIDPSILELYSNALSLKNEEIFSINLHLCELGMRQSKFLSIILPYCTNIKKLNLSCTSLCDKSIKYITKSFPTTTTLEILDIGHNPITPIGLEYFIHGIKYLKSLSYLDISGTSIDALVIQTLKIILSKSESIKELYMNQLFIKGQHLDMLFSEDFISLKKFSIEDNLINQDDLNSVLLLKKFNLDYFNLRDSKLSQDSKKMLYEEFGDILII